MTILYKNSDKMFTIFSLEGEHYLSAVAGGVAQYGITIWLSKEETEELLADKDRAESLAFKLTASPESFEDRRVRPSIDP